MALNKFKKLVLYSSIILSSLAIPGIASAQTTQVKVNPEKVIFEEQRRKDAINAYNTLKLNVADSAGILKQISTGQEIQNAKKTLEGYLGEELYHKTSAGIQTYPSSGTGSISFEDGEYYVNTTQVGIGKLNGENYSYAKFKAEAPRDFSYTYSIFFNAAGYNGEIPENTDKRLKKIVSKNSGIPSDKIEVKRETQALKIDDIVSTETGKSQGALNDHPTVEEYVIPDHILFVPGQKAKFPLDNIAYIVDIVEETPDTIKVPYTEVKIDTVFVPAPEKRDSVPKQAEEAKEYRLIFMGSATNTGVPGLKVAAQIWKKLDVEFGYDFTSMTDKPFERFTSEEKQHESISNYVGHSELTEKGVGDIKLNSYNLGLVVYPFEKGNIGFFGGVNATNYPESYTGQEDRKTWVLNTTTGKKLSPDEIVTEVKYENSEWKFNPQVGLRVHLGRVVGGIDYIVDINKFTPSYNDDFDGLGNLRFSIGFNMGAKKSKKSQNNQSSTGNYDVSYDYVQK